MINEVTKIQTMGCEVMDYLSKDEVRSVNELAKHFEVDNFFMQQVVDQLVENKELKKKSVGRQKVYQKINKAYGTVKRTKNGGKYVVVDDKKYYIKKSNINVSAGDVISYEIIDKHNVQIIKLEQDYNRQEIGTVIMQRGKAVIKEDRFEDIIETKENIIVGDRVLFTRGKLIRENTYSGCNIKAIGREDDPTTNMYAKLKQNGFEIKYPSEVIDEVNAIPTTVSSEDIKDRKDLRNETIFTIDGDDAKDLDDAVGIKTLDNGNYVLKVSIADVSHYVKEGTAIDLDAQKRGTSAYPPGAVVAMLMHKLSNGICSLFQDVDRLTFTCEMEYKPNGDLVNYKIYESVINSKKRMTYNNVNKVLDGDCPEDYKPFEQDLSKLVDLTDNLRKKRINNGEGSVIFSNPEYKIIFDENKNPIDVEECIQGKGQKLIEESMLAANRVVAMHIALKLSNEFGFKLPGMFRVHAEPDIEKVNDVIELMQSDGIEIAKVHDVSTKTINGILDVINTTPRKEVYNNLLLCSMSKAVYSVDNTGHYALDFPFYCHFTSPIRRYPDLIVHRLLKKYLSGKKITKAEARYLFGYLTDVAFHCSIQEKKSDMVERDLKQQCVATMLQNQVGQEYEGYVDSISEKGLRIKINNKCIYGFVKYTLDKSISKGESNKTAIFNGESIKIGDPMTVELVSANKNTGEVNFKAKKLSLVKDM